MTAGPCFQTAPPAAWFLNPRLAGMCNCDPARAESLQWGTLGWACSGAGTSQVAALGARGARPCLPHPTPPTADLARPPLLEPPCARAPRVPSLSGFPLALFLSSPVYRSLRRLHVEFPGPEKQSGARSESGARSREPPAPWAPRPVSPRALLRSVSARGNLPSPGVCQYD